ncbi:MAG TPA: hypothetical protein VIM69_10865, partial [Opitutaceae bacterium]
IAAAAPPVFLLDANRSSKAPPEYVVEVLAPRTFDNRSVVFASDFPSATFLRQHKIERILIVHTHDQSIGLDLRYALKQWVHDGLVIDVVTEEGRTFPVRWPRNGLLGEIFLKVFVTLRFHRNEAGVFGSFLPTGSGG